MKVLDERLKYANDRFIGDKASRKTIATEHGEFYINPAFDLESNKGTSLYESFSNRYHLAEYGTSFLDPYEQYISLDTEISLDSLVSTIKQKIKEGQEQTTYTQQGTIVIFSKCTPSKTSKEYIITYYEKADFDFLKKILPEALAAKEKNTNATSIHSIFNKKKVETENVNSFSHSTGQKIHTCF